MFHHSKFVLPAFGILFVLFVFAIGCQPERSVPDVSDIDVSVKIKRFERDLFSIDTNQVQDGMLRLQEEYGDFFDEVFLHIMRDRPEISAETVVRSMVTTPQIRQLYDTCQIVFDDISGVEAELTGAMKFFKYYFPQRPIPQVVSYISEFSLGTFTYGDSLMGVGWDFFLGEGDPHYDPNIFPLYIQRTMSRLYLVPKMVEALAGNLVGDVPGNRLLDYMIYNGKVLYIKDLLLPHTPDSIKLEYTADQLKWLEKNDRAMWAYFLKENLLYSSKMQDIQKLINHSPVAPGGMPREAPGRAANWVGLQIIKSYMRQYPDTNLEDLLAMNDAQKLLEMSKYKPKR